MKNDVPSVNYCDGPGRCFRCFALFVFMLSLLCFCVRPFSSVYKDLYKRAPFLLLAQMFLISQSALTFLHLRSSSRLPPSIHHSHHPYRRHSSTPGLKPSQDSGFTNPFCLRHSCLFHDRLHEPLLPPFYLSIGLLPFLFPFLFILVSSHYLSCCFGFKYLTAVDQFGFKDWQTDAVSNWPTANHVWHFAATSLSLLQVV